MREERSQDGKLAYGCSDVAEVVELLHQHADAREASFDHVDARALRLAAEEFKNGVITEYVNRARYMLEAACDEGAR